MVRSKGLPAFVPAPPPPIASSARKRPAPRARRQATHTDPHEDIDRQLQHYLDSRSADLPVTYLQLRKDGRSDLVETLLANGGLAQAMARIGRTTGVVVEAPVTARKKLFSEPEELPRLSLGQAKVEKLTETSVQTALQKAKLADAEKAARLGQLELARRNRRASAFERLSRPRQPVAPPESQLRPGTSVYFDLKERGNFLLTVAACALGFGSTPAQVLPSEAVQAFQAIALFKVAEHFFWAVRTGMLASAAKSDVDPAAGWFFRALVTGQPAFTLLSDLMEPQSSSQ